MTWFVVLNPESTFCRLIHLHIFKSDWSNDILKDRIILMSFCRTILLRYPTRITFETVEKAFLLKCYRSAGRSSLVQNTEINMRIEKRKLMVHLATGLGSLQEWSEIVVALWIWFSMTNLVKILTVGFLSYFGSSCFSSLMNLTCYLCLSDEERMRKRWKAFAWTVPGAHRQLRVPCAPVQSAWTFQHWLVANHESTVRGRGMKVNSRSMNLSRFSVGRVVLHICWLFAKSNIHSSFTKRAVKCCPLGNILSWTDVRLSLKADLKLCGNVGK